MKDATTKTANHRSLSLRAVSIAAAYNIATNPIPQALMLLCLFRWEAAAAWIALYTACCIGAVLASVNRISPLTGSAIRTPPRESIFYLFGNDQDGLWVSWYEEKYPKWMRWICPFMWTWWRNKMRNLPFLFPRLHSAPDAPITVSRWMRGNWSFELWRCGWMLEFKYTRGNRYGDFGPRLDQPKEWGVVSWAFRPLGRG